MSRIRKQFENIDFRPRNTPYTQFWAFQSDQTKNSKVLKLGPKMSCLPILGITISLKIKASTLFVFMKP